MKELEKDKGITLIALVVTVIVLIILAAVTINLLIGTNGIITRTQDAALDTRGATVQERIALWEAEKVMGAQTKKRVEFLNDLETEGLLKADEREKLESTGEIVIGSKTITIDLSYSLDLEIEGTGRNLISFYSTDGGATWLEIAQNKLHVKFKNDILIYLLFDLRPIEILFFMEGAISPVLRTNEFLTTPTADTSGLNRVVCCYKIPAVKDFDMIWEIIGMI